MNNRDGSQQPTSGRGLSRVAARLLARAQAESRAGDAAAAAHAIAGAISLAPDHPEVLRWAGIAAQDAGDHAAAAEYFRKALDALPDDADLQVGRGVALYRAGRRDEGVACLRRACDLAPASTSAWYNLAEALKPQVHTAAAVGALRRVLALDPAHMPARLGLARALASVGQVREAAAELRGLLRMQPSHVGGWLALADLQAGTFDGDDASRLEALLAQPDLAPEAGIRLRFVFAKALEDQGNFVRAMDELQRANAAQRRRVRWDSVGEHRRVDALLRIFAGPVAAAPDAAGGHEVIFIASLPRSGSTLVEQILASHPQVAGANEISAIGDVVNGETLRRHAAFPLWVPMATAGDWQRLGSEYLARTMRWRGHAPRFTDKNLLNWMFVGASLAMLPAARVVIVRRDPVETCLGCYRQWFDHGAEFSYDFDELATFCGDFIRLTRFWLQRFPDRVFDLQYETLVAEPEPTIRRLLDFCGLPFDPACLEFHKTPRTVLSAPSAAQVRQPLHATARAARYGHLLDGLRDRLRDAGLPDTPE